MNLIADMWSYAELCSHDKQDSGDGDTDKRDYIRDQFANITFLQMNNALEYCYVVEEANRIIIVFRGTDGGKAWRNNFRITPPYANGYMHRGFYSILQDFIPAIKDILAALPADKQLYITGHSLGGIISQYVAAHIWETYKRHSICVNFGSPVGGLKKWATILNSYPIRNIRVVNGWDLVTEIMDDITHGHAGELVRLPQSVLHRLAPVQLLDHAYSRYTDSIIKYSQKLGDTDAVTMLKKVRARCNI